MARRSSTVRALALAWTVVAAIVGLAWLLRSEPEGPAFRQVEARYERQPRPRLTVAAPRAPEAEASVAEVATHSEAVAPVRSAAVTWTHPPAGTSRIFGRVTARESGEPVAGVLVLARSTDWSWAERATAVTGADGAYELRALPAATIRVSVFSDEADVAEERWPEPVVLRDDESRQLDLQVSRAGRIWGRVTDRAGHPLKNVKVLVGTGESVVTQVATIAATQREPLNASTDDDGRYEVRGVPFEQEWLVWFDDERHAPALSPSFVLHATRPQARVDAALLDGTRISGRVLDTASHPIAGAKVVCMPRVNALLAPMRKAHTIRDTLSDDDGAFAVDGIPPGEYQVLAFHEGYRIELKGTSIYPDGQSPIGGLELVLHAVMEGDHVVFGFVRDGSGAPVADAHVGLAAVGVETLSFGGRDAKSGADGSFRFEGVGDEQFLLVVEKSGFRHAVEEVGPDHEVKVELVASSTISGKVVRADGSPADPFTVRIVSAGESASIADRMESLGSLRSFKDAGGKFELQDVPPGHLVLEAAAADSAPGRLTIDVARGESARDVVIRLAGPGSTVRGRVTASDGTPVRGARVSIAELGSSGALVALALDRENGAGATTDGQGGFSIPHLAAAQYRIRVFDPKHAPATVDVAVPFDQIVDVNPVLASGGTIAGRAPSGAMITIAGDAFSTMAAADDDGVFKIERVPAGEHLVRAVIGDEKSIVRAPVVRRCTVHVVEGATTTVDFAEQSARNRSIGGRVAAPAKGTVVVVMLRVQGSPPPDPASLFFQGGRLGSNDAETSRSIVAEGVVREDGSYVLPDVPPGRYTQDVWVTSLLGALAGKQATLQERKEVVVE